MPHKLIGEKKVGYIRGNRNGFFSNMRETIASLYECEIKGYKPYVDWGQSIYKEDKYGVNPWEYYFEPLNSEGKKIPIKNKFPHICGKSITLPPPNLRPTKGYKIKVKNTTETRRIMNNTIKKYVKIKPFVNEKIISFWDYHVKPNDRVIGVHLRMTDKFVCHRHSEPVSGKPISTDVYIKHINKYIEKESGNVKIFLATDSKDGLKKMVDHFGNKIFYQDNIRSEGKKSIHQSLKGVSNFKKGLDVLTDSILLSKCDFLFKGISSMSMCSLFFNENLKQFNLNQHYKKDFRESFIEQDLTYII